jgi:biotin operon repressor
MSQKSKTKTHKVEKSTRPLAAEKYEEMIITLLKQNPSGLTITDISNKLEISRITVNKYVLVLEAKGILFSKSIGAYNLYFTTERSFIPKDAMNAYYQGLMAGFASQLPEHKEEIFKKVGLGMDQFITFPVGSRFPDDVLKPESGSYKKLFEYYAQIYDKMDYLVENTAEIEVKINEKGNKAVFSFKNIKFLKVNVDFAMHFYIIAGMIEKTLPKIIKKKVICNVEKIYDTNVDLSIEII